MLNLKQDLVQTLSSHCLRLDLKKGPVEKHRYLQGKEWKMLGPISLPQAALR